MKSAMLLVLTLLMSNASMAQSDICLKKLQSKYATDAKKDSSWDFDGITSVNKPDVKLLIEDSYEEIEIQKEKMLSLVKNKNILFYLMSWNAPSNSGGTIVAADKKTCKPILEILYQSEE